MSHGHDTLMGMAVALVLGMLPLGCTSSVERYFVPESLVAAYEPVAQARVHEIGSQDIEAVRQRLYAHAEVVGRSQFTAGDMGPRDVERFARSIGADVVIWRQDFLATTTTTRLRHIPRSETTRITTTVEGKPVQTEIQQYRHDTVPEMDTRVLYEHEVLFLRAER